MGSTGDSPVPAGDSPTGRSRQLHSKGPSLLPRGALPIPPGESPGGTGQWLVLPRNGFPDTLSEVLLRPCRSFGELETMKTLLAFLLWCILLVLCWPVAILALVLFPFVWLVLWPFRLAGWAIGAFFSLIKAILFLPARLLGSRRSS